MGVSGIKDVRTERTITPSNLLKRLRKSSSRRVEFAKQRIYGYVAKRYLRQCRQGDVLFQSGRPFDLNHWIFHDEDWVRVRNRREHRIFVAAGKTPDVVDNQQNPSNEIITYPSGDVSIHVRALTCDEWIYLYLDPDAYVWTNYSWEFDVRRETDFRELQFGFRYRDFYNRYRYRFEAGFLFFDKVIRGKFYNGLNAEPFPMKLDVDYHVRIDAYKNHFRCYVNNVLISSDHDFDCSFPHGSIALILWEDDGKTDIKATFGPISIRRLTKKMDG